MKQGLNGSAESSPPREAEAVVQATASSPPNAQAHSYTPSNQHSVKHLGFARSLAWIVLVLVLLLTATLSAYIGNKSREILLSKQRDFAALLAENLNRQIYRRFTLPTVLGFGSIALRQTAQYERLDQVVQSTIHGLNVSTLRIFGHDGTVTYSSDREELGSTELQTANIEKAAKGTEAIFSLDTKIPYWKAFFQIPLAPQSYILRIAYPLRIENRLNSSNEFGPIMGVLEFSQDITSDIENAIRFQQVIIITTMGAATILFLLLLVFIRRAEHAMAIRMQEEQRLVLELHQNEKLAGMGRVIASIAHEIRNPLGIIRSSAELLLKRNAGADAMTGRILQAIYDESKRLSQTVSDFLDYARPRPLKTDPIDINGTIQKALVFLEPDLQARKILIVHTGEQGKQLFVLGDSDLLYRAFYNIMSNSIQAMGSSGTLTIDLQKQSGREPQVIITFTDSGAGFPQEHIERLLDPFFTTKDDGTGLGLPIVSSIILSHKGTMHLSNAPAGGAVITITLPLHSFAIQETNHE